MLHKVMQVLPPIDHHQEMIALLDPMCLLKFFPHKTNKHQHGKNMEDQFLPLLLRLEYIDHLRIEWYVRHCRGFWIIVYAIDLINVYCADHACSFVRTTPISIVTRFGKGNFKVFTWQHCQG